jgi:hypothetical protein
MTDKITDTSKIDLHTHSTSSDGTLSPREVAERAKNEGLCAIALTDHDTIGGLREFTDACEEMGIEGIRGVEISARYSKEMHILGLFVDAEDKTLNEKLETLKNAREVRNRAVLELMAKNGIDITEEDILSQKDGATLANTGRAHLARAMVNKGYVSSTDEAFSKYLKKGNCCYVERVTYSPRESIEMIKNAGGLAILAHPIYITDKRDELYKLAKELKEYGLDGMECYYNCYTSEFSRMCKEICKELNLLKSGGSDFHGANKPDIEIGKVSEGFVPYEVLDKMKRKMGL